MPGSHASPPEESTTLVVGYDGSAESHVALDAAAHVAGPLGKIWIVVCFDEPPGWLGAPNRDAALNDAEAEARSLIAGLEADAVPALQRTHWEVELIPGPPADAIMRVAEVRDADEIFIGSRGRGRTRSVIGSVSHDVLHHTDRPVRIFTQRAAERLTRMPAPAP
jgi:nucleotide-binding universal stress UspA family protein